nr:retrovirus-related Pol polyprotein from transposon TNT 1-94 [Tanacetum cinerariifolium]
MKKAYSILILCLEDCVLREVTKETTVARIWTKLTSQYMTKSLANRLYSKKELYTYYMSLGTKVGDHIDEFNKLIFDLTNIDIEIKDEDQTLMLLTSLPSSYENFVDTLSCGSESLTMEDVLATLNSRELKKKTEGTKEENGDGLYVRGRGSSKERLSIKKSSRFVKKGKRGQYSDSSDDEGNAYFQEAIVVVGNDEMTELVMNSCESYHMTHMRNFLYDFKVVDGGSVQLGDNRTCTIKGTRKGAQGDREAEVFQVSNDVAAVTQRRLENKKLKEKTNRTACVAKQDAQQIAPPAPLSAALLPQNLNIPFASTMVELQAPTPTKSSTDPTNIASFLDTLKSTYGGTQFRGEKLVCWSSKKQDCTTLSIAEAEYVPLSAC